jgi:transposase
MPYKALACQHALYNTHHLRELIYLLEEHRQTWTEDMIERLTHANHQDTINYVQDKAPNYQAKKYQTQVNVLRDLYDAILAQCQIEHLRIGPTGKPGWPKQSKATNLTRGLVDCIEDVWRFITQANVPFTNNLAEQAVRMRKVKQSISRCFRTRQDMKTYCAIRSYCATLQKQGVNLFNSLVAAFKGVTLQLNFGLGGGAWLTGKLSSYAVS